MKLISWIMALLVLSLQTFGSSNTQKIRGTVLDKQSQSSIVGATVQLMINNEMKGTQN
jgi:hypothetical protein